MDSPAPDGGADRIAPRAAAVTSAPHAEVAGEALLLCVREWLVPDPQEAFCRVLRQLADASHFGSPYATRFGCRKMAALVYCSNKLERTLPQGAAEHETYALIEGLAEANCGPSDMAQWRQVGGVRWEADGARDGTGARQQFMQHMRALRFLLSRLDAPMTVDILMDTHTILMTGAMHSGRDVAAGVLRNHSCHDGSGHVYPDGDPAKLRGALTRIAEAFNDEVAARVLTPEVLVTAPIRLFYDVVTLHPFSDGNGRLSRLLFAFAVRQLGVPFAVPLTSGHRKARGHYMRAILLARRGHFEELQTLALMSIGDVLNNFAENVRLMGDA